jgi:Bacterial archaeo-eukaryotic release factor family 7
MDTLKRTDLQQLIETDGEWHVSIYIPTHHAGSEQQQNPIRLKNMLAQAEKQLLRYGVRRPDVQEMIRPAEDLLVDRDFWQYQGEGLAVFLSKEASRIYRLPNRFEETITVGKSFDVKPLLPLVNENSEFYILALSQNQTRLFRASRETLSEVELKDVPTNMGQALRIDDPQKNLGFQTSTANSGGTGSERPAIHYGQGVEDDKKELIRRYFQVLDQGLTRQLEDESAPMVLAGVDYLLPIYREVSTYRNLLDEGLVGSPDREDLNEMRELAWKVVEPIFLRNQQQAIDRFLELHGQQNGLASSDLDTTVKAAIAGRVETLIVPLGVQKWGRYDPAADSVIFDTEPTPENEDMLNFAAVQTILNSGNVYAVPMEQFPKKGDVAAIFRYAI